MFNPRKKKRHLRAERVLKIFNRSYTTKKLHDETKKTLKHVLRELIDLKRKIRFISLRTISESKLIDLLTEIEQLSEKIIPYESDKDIGEDIKMTLEHLREAESLLSQRNSFTSALEIDRGIHALTDAIAIFEMNEWKIDISRKFNNSEYLPK